MVFTSSCPRYFDNLTELAKHWPHQLNVDGTGKLLVGFFQYYLYNYDYDANVISIRTSGGLLHQLSKKWESDYPDTGLFIEVISCFQDEDGK